MRTFKSVWVLGICAPLLLGSASLSDWPGQEYCWKLRDEVPNPIKKSVNAWVDRCNVLLESLVGNLRKWDEARIKEELPNIKQDFAKTYLRFPILEKDQGDKFGWDEVIWELDMIADKEPDVRIGPVEVEAILLPYAAKTGNDLRLNIRTHLILGSEDPALRGCGIHRNDCTPVECQ
ncbi:MAG: hypothetical protein WBC70_01910 [Candidatus Aminicenantales bacterium]